MARRNDRFLEILMLLPWWVSVVISAIAYVILVIVIPSIDFQNPLFQGIAQRAPDLAPVLALILLVPAPISAINAYRKRKLVDSQKGIETIRNLSWRQFEELVAEAYRRDGYQVVENQRGGPDGGVDVRLKRPGELHLIQCKHWKSQNIGVATVRELYGVMAAESATAGKIVCSGVFTQDAKSFAEGKSIDLVEGAELLRFIGSVQTENRLTANQDVKDHLTCPECASGLVQRKARKGANTGNVFLGCSAFPKCRYTQSLNG